MRTWEDTTVELLRASADLDVRSTGEVAPRLAAFVGDRPLFLAELRPFEERGYHRPVIELLALAGPLGADRLAVAMTGRLTSLDDPIPPVIDGLGDLRQRALVIALADGHGHEAVAGSRILPFDLAGDRVTWGEGFDPGPGEGWIVQILPITIDQRHELAGTDDAIRAQAERCLELGHVLILEEQVAERLGIDAAPIGGS